MTMKCDMCTSPQRIFVSSYCPGCDEIVCGKCAVAKMDHKNCNKCGQDMFDFDRYLAAYEDKSLSIDKHRICGRIMYSIGVRSKEDVKNPELLEFALNECLKQTIELGDIQCAYSLLVKKEEYDFEDYAEYYHLAIIGHSTARQALSDFWYEDRFETEEEPKLLRRKVKYWTKMAAFALDGLSLSRVGQDFLLKGDDKRALNSFLLSAKYFYVPAYGLMARYWLDKGNEEMARRNYYDGVLKGCRTSQVMAGIYQAEGGLGIPKNPEEGLERVNRVFKLRSSIGNLHSAVVTARNWLATVYYGDKSVGTVVPEIKPNRELAMDIINEGIEVGDAVSMTVKAKILLRENIAVENSDDKMVEAANLLARAVELGCEHAKTIIIPNII